MTQLSVQSILQTDLNARTVGIAVSALVLLAIVYQLWLYPYFFSPIRKVPGPKGSLLDWRYVLFGEFPKIMRGEAGIVQREWAKEYGTIIRAVGPFGISRMMFLSPTAVHKVLVSDWVEYPRPSFMRNILGIVAGYGLLTVTGDEHRQMRRFMNPAFSIPSLSAQTHMYYKPIYDLVDIIKGKIKDTSGNVFHVYDLMSMVTLDIICLTAFGYECDSLHNPKNELADAYHKLLDLQSGQNLARLIAVVSLPGMPKLIKSEWLYNHRHWLRNWSHLKALSIMIECMHRIERVSSKILSDANAHATAVASSDSTLKGKKDVMSLLVQARMNESDGSGYKMSDSMMMQQVLTFLGAGHETTASGLTWTLWLLATHPEIQSKLRGALLPTLWLLATHPEIQSKLRGALLPVIAEHPNPDVRTLKSIEYLDYVVMESLRVMPPVPMTIRQAGKSDFIDGVWIPKGTLFYIAIRVINTYKGFWGEDAEEFRPERWGKLNEAPAYHPLHSLQTFINGPHHCIGKTMAIVEMKAVLAYVHATASHFSLLDHETHFDSVFSIIIANFEFAPAYVGQTTRPTAAVTMSMLFYNLVSVKPLD
ncbi:cytochrome P450 [Sanghuangporus baumii]|uniref:Cytochrome P450 n=1 Tax=Sanghuangporus baumii TaxID=108892 RepID=A0A9Q5I601_SANBA|nr:cytochrome P450 [Sanghuangporus baumii]